MHYSFWSVRVVRWNRVTLEQPFKSLKILLAIWESVILEP